MLNKYEELLEEAAAQNISVDENFPFHGNLKGLYVDQNYRPLGPIGDLCRKTPVFWQKNLVITTLLLEIFWISPILQMQSRNARHECGPMNG